jgi:hypothetical protein
MKKGRIYKIVGSEKRDGKFFHTVKNDKGEFAEFEHEELIEIVEQNQP